MGPHTDTFRKMAGLLRAIHTMFRILKNIFSIPKGMLKINYQIIIFLLIIIPIVSISAEDKKINNQRIIPLSSSLYEEIDRLYILQGLAHPSTARPWSLDEALLSISRLSLKNLSSAESASMEIINSELAEKIDGGEKGKFAYSISGEMNIEAYYKVNDKREEWEHGFEERKPFLYIPMELWFNENLYSTLDVTLKEEYRAVTELDNNYTGIPSNPVQFDWYFPFRAFISLGGENWNIQFGRDQADWGMGETGNLLLSDYSDFYNLLKFTTYWEKFKYSAVYIGLDSWLTTEEKELDEDPEDGNGLAGGYYNFQEQFKAFLAHRVEFRTTEKLNLTVSEAVVFGNKYLNFTELNPVFVFHNLFSPEYSNALLSVEADYTIFKGLNLYLQYAVDEFQVPGYEGPDSRPGADGVLAGFRYIKPAPSGSGYITLNGEAAMTDPYFYNRWHPLTRFTNRRRIWSNIEPDKYEYINKPIGYEHGPDAIVLYSKIGYINPLLFSASFDARYILKGELNDSLDDPLSYDTGDEANDQNTASGTAEKELVVGIHSTVFPQRKFSYSADIYWINITDYQHIRGETLNDFEIALSSRIRF